MATLLGVGPNAKKPVDFGAYQNKNFPIQNLGVKLATQGRLPMTQTLGRAIVAVAAPPKTAEEARRSGMIAIDPATNMAITTAPRQAPIAPGTAFSDPTAFAGPMKRVGAEVTKKATEPAKQILATIGKKAVGALNDVSDDLVESYLQRFKNVINTDNARELFPEYVADRTKSAVVHERASTVAKRAYDALLKTQKGAGNNTVLFTAGGTGSGKTTALKQVGTFIDEYPIVYDGNLNKVNSAVTKIDKALDNGFNVELHFIYNDIKTSLDNALARAEGEIKELGSGRTLPIQEHVDTHIPTPDAILELMKKYGNRITVRATDNAGNVVKPTGNLLDFLNKVRYTADKYDDHLREATEQVRRALAEGRISNATAEGFLGTTGKAGRSGIANVLAGSQETGAKTPGDAVKRLVEKLGQAEEFSRPDLEKLYAQERSRRTGAVAGIFGRQQGMQGYYQALGKLKGELAPTKPSFAPLKIDAADMDELANTVQSSAKLMPLEKVGAISALRGLSDGVIPTQSEIELLSKVFPRDVIDAILAKRTPWEKAMDLAQTAINVPRAIQSTGDLSAPLRQGIAMLHHPVLWTKNFGKMFKMAWKEGNFQAAMEEITKRPTYQKMREAGLMLPDIDSPMLTQTEERFMGSNIVEKVPVFGRLARASNRAYTGFLNKLRADVFDSLYKDAQKLGISDNPKLLQDIAKVINTSSGRGELGPLQSAAPVLNALLFSPRLAASRINMLFNPMYYTRLEPLARKEALKSLFTFITAWATVAGTVKMFAGDEADVVVDPRNADFGKIKMGDTRFDIAGGFQQYIRAAAQLMSGTYISSATGRELRLGEGYKAMTRADILQRLFESKESPMASFVTGLIKGKNYMGEDFNIPAEMIDRMIPMVWSDAIEAMSEEGLLEATRAIPGAFGVGVQKYTDLIPFRSKTASGAEKVEWRAKPSVGEMIVNKLTGKEITDIPPEEQKRLLAERDAEIQRSIDLDKAKAQVLSTGESQMVGETLVYLDNGVVKTKKLDSVEQRPEVEQKLTLKSRLDSDEAFRTQSKELYDSIQSFKRSGGWTNAEKAQAQARIEALSDEQYEAYQGYKEWQQTYKADNTRRVRDLLSPDPAQAVEFIRSLPEEEKTRILDLLTDEEYQTLKSGETQAQKPSNFGVVGSQPR